ncbi:MAG: hypothetical protein CBC35_05360 [Planctomycetes bacterium TMED75]|nr:peptide chain release factor-like protein [Planctomycetaceae bacterium]OUU93581.1 MAG: hypothetical protein CBC35_05360 [Planctomycetes bacterium TMED75]
MGYRPPYRDPDSIYLDAPHPSTLDEGAFMSECEVSAGRSSGPGGQHRNKVQTGIRVVHLPTGIEARGTERREAQVNRSRAIFRLRLKLARNVRTQVGRDNHEPSELWEARRQGRKLPVNPKHPDYPALLAEALDVVYARKFDVAGAAGVLRITMSQLTRVIRQEPPAISQVNRGRERVGLPRLRS